MAALAHYFTIIRTSTLCFIIQLHIFYIKFNPRIFRTVRLKFLALNVYYIVVLTETKPVLYIVHNSCTSATLLHSSAVQMWRGCSDTLNSFQRCLYPRDVSYHMELGLLSCENLNRCRQVHKSTTTLKRGSSVLMQMRFQSHLTPPTCCLFVGWLRYIKLSDTGQRS